MTESLKDEISSSLLRKYTGVEDQYCRQKLIRSTEYRRENPESSPLQGAQITAVDRKSMRLVVDTKGAPHGSSEISALARSGAGVFYPGQHGDQPSYQWFVAVNLSYSWTFEGEEMYGTIPNAVVKESGAWRRCANL